MGAVRIETDEGAPSASAFVEAVSSGLIRSSPTLGQLFAALSAAQGEMKDPPKDKVAKVPMKAGGTYSYKYSDLADLLKNIRPVFAKHGLCIVQFPLNPHRGAVTIVTRIGHASGEWMDGDLTLAVGDEKPQTLGSAITYGRRYSAGGVAGLSPDEDEDGQTAQEAAPERQRSAWQSERKEPAQARSGAMDAARRAIETPLAKEVINPGDQFHAKKLVAQLKSKNYDEAIFEEVGNRLRGKTWDDVFKVAEEVAREHDHGR